MVNFLCCSSATSATDALCRPGVCTTPWSLDLTHYSRKCTSQLWFFLLAFQASRRIWQEKWVIYRLNSAAATPQAKLKYLIASLCTTAAPGGASGRNTSWSDGKTLPRAVWWLFSNLNETWLRLVNVRQLDHIGYSESRQPAIEHCLNVNTRTTFCVFRRLKH